MSAAKLRRRVQRDTFGNSFGVLLALAGSAVGLGNLWRFPYLVGQNGGAAFIILYLIFVTVLGIPLMLSEFIIGRRSRANARGAFRTLAPGTRWDLTGFIAVLCCTLILSFYSVVGGWGIEYFYKALRFDFTMGLTGDLSTLFSGFTASTWRPLVCHTLFMLATGLIVAYGVKNGIERFSKVMMPLLFIIMIGIAVRSLTLDGAGAGIDYLFRPDWSKVTSHTVLDALGQAFFSLSLGSGMVITYASYVKAEANITKICINTAVADTVFALIAGCAIMPAVFAFAISPGEGPGLVFITLPYIFSQLPLGGVIALLFFLALLLAALTSSISILEVVVAFAIEELKLKRKTAVWLCMSFIWLLGCLCSLSLGRFGSELSLFGRSLFDLFDAISANVLMPLNAMLVVIFLGWKMGRGVIADELTNNGANNPPAWYTKSLYIIIRWLAPAAIFAIALFQWLG